MLIGDNAPDFELLDKDGNKVSLKSHKGKWVVLYFYPKDDTPGCTIEAVDFTRFADDFKRLGAVVLGVSPDSTKSHCGFAEKHGLDIVLLSDPDHKIIEKYDAWQLKKMYGKEYYGVVRSTFLIDPKGKITFIWQKVQAQGHAEEVLGKLKELSRKIL